MLWYTTRLQLYQAANKVCFGTKNIIGISSNGKQSLLGRLSYYRCKPASILVLVCPSRTSDFGPEQKNIIGISSNGRTSGFGPEYRGSSPCIPAREKTLIYKRFFFRAGVRKAWEVFRQGLEDLLSIFWS